MPDDPYREWTTQAKRFRPDLERLLCRKGAVAYPNNKSLSHRAGYGWPKGGKHTILALAEDEPGNGRILLRLSVGPQHKKQLILQSGIFTSATATDADKRDRVDCYLHYGKPVPQEVVAAVELALGFVTSSDSDPVPVTPEPTLIASDVSDPPPRVKVEVSRIVRDTAAAHELKTRLGHKCQLCGNVLLLGMRPYSEAHHLQPLGGDYRGVDEQWNMLVVCPNCHAKLDFGAVRLSMNELFAGDLHRPRQAAVDYHNDHICKQVVPDI